MGVGYQIALPGEEQEKPRVIVRVGAQIGQGTNNEAEWHALISLMRHALRLGFWELSVQSDSLLVTRQYQGVWKARGRLARLRDEAQNLGRLFNAFRIRHVYREANAEADALSHTLTFDEPSLPLPLKHTNTSRRPKYLTEWQAASIRIWSLRHHPGAGTLSRVFGIATPAIEAIAAGTSYRTADFSGYAEWIYSVVTPGYAAYQDYEEKPQLNNQCSVCHCGNEMVDHTQMLGCPVFVSMCDNSSSQTD